LAVGALVAPEVSVLALATTTVNATALMKRMERILPPPNGLQRIVGLRGPEERSKEFG
jgi:hypothetical protein